MGKGSGSETAASIRTGMQKDYLLGLDNLRKLVTNIECDLDKLKREFYCCDANDEDEYEKHLRLCNSKFLYCNNKLRKNQIDLDVIDGEVKLVSILNKVRDLDDNIDPDVVSFLTEFWERIKGAVDGIQSVKRKFHETCFKRLKSRCISYNDNAGGALELTQTYTEDVNRYQGNIVDTLRAIDQLTKSYTLGVKQELYTNSTFTNRVLISCDPKAFPILKLIPDLTEKLSYMCSLSNQWMDKDETYVHDIGNFVREQRHQTRKKKQDLRNRKERHTEISQSVDEAYNLFKENKAKLAKIDSELQTLEQTANRCSDSKKYKADEARQKEGMLGFLDISISQTKKNYTLQLKRSRLSRQLRELEESLKEIEIELSEMEEDSNKKTIEKAQLKEKMEDSNFSYMTLKSELENFNKVVDDLQKEVDKLSDTLTQGEIIQNFKTSPENVEDFFERPVTVKLAPSLREKIMSRRRRQNPNHV